MVTGWSLMLSRATWTGCILRSLMVTACSRVFLVMICCYDCCFLRWSCWYHQHIIHVDANHAGIINKPLMLMLIWVAQSVVAMTNIEVKKELLETMASQDAIGVAQVASGLDASRFAGPTAMETQQESMETMATYAPGDTIAEAWRCMIVWRVGSIHADRISKQKKGKRTK